MLELALTVVALVLVVHGLIHLMGTAVYMKLTDVQGLTYKTTLLGGRLNLGEGGMRIFGALWLLPALGFVVVAVALVLGGDWWPPLLLTVTVFSLVLTTLDWSNAFMGAITDTGILAVLWLGPRLADWWFG